MEDISKFFGKFIKLKRDSEITKNKISEIIKDISLVNLSAKEIHLKGDTLYLNCSPVAKNQIIMKKEQIVENLSFLFGVKNIKWFIL